MSTLKLGCAFNLLRMSIFVAIATPVHALSAVQPSQEAVAVNDIPYANIISQSSQKCADIPTNSTTDGSPVTQMSCSAKNVAQIWKVISITPTQYQIISNNSGMCLDVGGASKLNGGKVKQSPCAGLARKNQIWNVMPLNGGYQIISENSNKCLDVTDWSKENGTVLQQWDCNGVGQANQIWKLEPVKPILAASPPLVITKSNTVVSNVKITNPSGPCIIISSASGNVSNVTIKNSEIGPCGYGPSLGNGISIQSPLPGGNVNNLVVDNVNFHDLQGSGISLISSYRAAQLTGNILSVSNSLFTNIQQDGIYISFVKPNAGDTVPSVPALSFTNNKLQVIPNAGFLIYGTNSAFVENNTFTLVQTGVKSQQSEGVRINNNYFSHLKPSSVNGHLSFGNFAEFNNVTGPNNSISCNIGLQDDYNTLPKSTDGVNDEISVYESSGTAISPLLVVGNKLMGGGQLQNVTGDVGSGITVGDGSGGSYINVIDNVLVNVGHGGLMGAGGNNVNFLNNKIFSIANPVNFYGLGYVNYAPWYGGGPCYDINVQNNRVNWMTIYGPDRTGWVNPLLSGSTICTNFVWSGNVFQDTSVTATLFTTYQPSECPMM